MKIITDPPAPEAVLTALAHVRSVFPETTMVVFQRDTKWNYMAEDFTELPPFGNNINTGILEDAANSVESFPAIFEIVPEEIL
jgi:hypothetical protein